MGIILILALLLSYCSDTKTVTLRRYHDLFIRGRNKSSGEIVKTLCVLIVANANHLSLQLN